jgi:co-chaperonin GroES (HSP10)
MELPKSKYLSYFIENGARLREQSQLVGDLLFVEKIKFPEKKVGGIIIADNTHKQLGTILGDQPTFFRVLLVGNGYYDDDTKEDVPLDINQGDIILTGAVSAKVFSSFPMLETTETDVLGVTRHGDIQWRFKGEEAFLEFLTTFNSSVKGQVAGRIEER